MFHEIHREIYEIDRKNLLEHLLIELVIQIRGLNIYSCVPCKYLFDRNMREQIKFF